MITIKKLKTLKESTQQRKIIKILYQLENNFTKEIESPLQYTKELLEIIKEKNPELSTQTKKIINQENKIELREINNLRYQLQTKIGEYPADWDLKLPTGELNNQKRKTLPISLYLEDLRAPFNIGSIFRSAESLGVKHIYLSPNCPKIENPKVKRTAMGTEKIIPHSVADINKLATQYPILALETGGTPISDFTFPRQDFIAVIGNEELGISPQTLELAKSSAGIVSIPTLGSKASINVGVATGIMLSHYILKF